MKSKVNIVLERYKQIHNMKGVTWNMELLQKYNMIEPLNAIKEKNSKLNKTELLRRMANYEYFDQWEPTENKTSEFRLIVGLWKGEGQKYVFASINTGWRTLTLG